MRKVLLAVSLVSAFVLIAEEASARPRGARSSNPAPKPPTAQTATKRPDARTAQAQKGQDTAAPPRHWRVAVPVVIPRAQRRDNNDAQGSPLAASAGADDIARAASMPQIAAAQAAAPPAAAARPDTKPRPASMPAANVPPRPIRSAMASPPTARKAVPDGPKLPHKFAVCYWNQTGQCVAR